MSALEDGRGLQPGKRGERGEMYTQNVQALHMMAPTALNGHDAVVQFERGMFSACAEIQWEAHAKRGAGV